jgi:hypothetical protein
MGRIKAAGLSPYDPQGRAELLAACRRTLASAAARMSRVPAPRVAAAAHPERPAGAGVGGAGARGAAAPAARHVRMALAALLDHESFLAWAAARAAPGGPCLRAPAEQCGLNLFGLYFTLCALALDSGAHGRMG